MVFLLLPAPFFLLIPILIKNKHLFIGYAVLAGSAFVALWVQMAYDFSRPFYNGGGFPIGEIIFALWTSSFISGFALRLVARYMSSLMKIYHLSKFKTFIKIFILLLYFIIFFVFIFYGVASAGAFMQTALNPHTGG